MSLYMFARESEMLEKDRIDGGGIEGQRVCEEGQRKK